MRTRLPALGFLLAALLATPGPASAQQAPLTHPALGPTVATLASLSRLQPAEPPRVEEANPPTVAMSRIGQGGRKEAVALMIVGGAGIITGLLVDEDIITIAGAGVAGIGLYLYLR